MPARKTPASKVPARKAGKTRSNIAVALDADASGKARAAAAMRLTWDDILVDKARFKNVLGLVRDASGPAELRYAALSALQSATFGGPLFKPYRADYLAALRAMRDEPDLELRQRAFGILARENDGDTQQQLLDGLKDPAQAKLPPEKALQLLSYDVHAGAFDAAREVAEHPPNASARKEALRVLAADGNSADMFEKVLRSKAEPVDVRQIAASALHQLSPQRLQQCAKDLAKDATEGDAVRALGLNALANFGDGAALADDKVLSDYVESIRNEAGDEATSLSRIAAKVGRRQSE